MNKDLEKVFKALANPTRLQLVQTLLKGKEFSCHELMDQYPLSQPTLSHHFNKLVDAQVLLVRKSGVNHYYSINKKYLSNLGLNVAKLLNSTA